MTIVSLIQVLVYSMGILLKIFIGFSPDMLEALWLRFRLLLFLRYFFSYEIDDFIFIYSGSGATQLHRYASYLYSHS